MHRRVLQTAMLIALLCVVSSALAWGSSVVVGNCKPGTRFDKIQAAVDAAAPGSTIQVCPGVYPEQVVINKTLIVKGVISGTVERRRQPSLRRLPLDWCRTSNFTGGMYGTVAPHLLIRDTTGVTISNVTITNLASPISGKPARRHSGAPR